MVKVVTEQVRIIDIKLSLSFEEAGILKAAMQNAFWQNEPEALSEIRRVIWEALKLEGVE